MAGTLIINKLQTNQHLGHYNVLNLNVKGDNQTDDSNAIQNLLDTESKLYFPKGVYLISKTLMITRDKIDIIGEEGSVIKNITPVHILEIHSENCNIQQIEFDGNRTAFSKSYSNVYITGNYNTIDKCKIYNSGSHGLCIDGQKHDPIIHIHDCKWNEVSSCKIFNNQQIGLSHNKGSNNRLVNNLIYNNGWEGITLDHDADSIIVSQNRLYMNMQLINNDWGGVGQIGIDRTKNSVISSNIITGENQKNKGTGGITFQNNYGKSEYNLVIGNIITDTKGWGILLRNNKNGAFNTGGQEKTCNYNIITNNILKNHKLGNVSIEYGNLGNIYKNNIEDTLLDSANTVQSLYQLAKGIFYQSSSNGEPNFIIALTGQSNSQGYGGVYEEDEAADQPHERIRGWNQVTKLWEQADLRNESIGAYSHKPKNHQSLAFHFAKRLVNKYPDIVVGIINYGVGGRPIAEWDENESGMIYAKHVGIINEALGKLSTKKNVDVICWHQGESDWDKPLTYYETALNNVISQYRRQSFCHRETPFIVGQTTQTGVWQKQNISLLNLNVDDDKYTECVDTGDLKHAEYNGQQDPIHFSAESHRILGLRYYKAFIRMQH